jgi:hypothetical protein
MKNRNKKNCKHEFLQLYQGNSLIIFNEPLKEDFTIKEPNIKCAVCNARVFGFNKETLFRIINIKHPNEENCNHPQEFQYLTMGSSRICLCCAKNFGIQTPSVKLEIRGDISITTNDLLN